MIKKISKSISFQHAKLTVLVAFLLSIVISLGQLFIDLNAEKKRLDDTMQQVLSISKESAVQAAINLDNDLAEQVAKGLFQFSPIYKAELADNFGDILAVMERSRPADKRSLKWLVNLILEPSKSYTVELVHPEYNKMMGEMTVEVDIHSFTQNFFSRAMVVFLSGLLRIFLLASFLFILFHYILTRPLLSIISSFAGITPGETNNNQINVSHIHRDDELGVLVRTINDLLGRFNSSIEKLTHTEESLRSSEEQIRLLLNSMAEAMYGLDLDGNCTFVNNSFLRMMGYKRSDELIGKHMHTLIHHSCVDGSPLPTKDCTIHKAFVEGKGVHAADEFFWRADGTSFPVEYLSYPIVQDNETIGAVVTFRDISKELVIEKERLTLERQLEQARKMEAIGLLAGGIAHDFNNILTPIFGYLELASIKIPEDSELANNLEEVQKAAYRAKDLVKQILSFSRQDTDNKSAIQVQIIVKEALKLLRASIPTTIEIRQNINSQCGAVMANPAQIHQIVMNICTNAYYAMRETGGILGVYLAPLEISQQDFINNINLKPGPYLQLEISDTGHGMDQAIRERIFEPYFTTKDKDEGTGMGLSIVHGLVSGMGGHITVYSEPGRGTTFHVYLPVIESSVFSGKKNTPKTVLPTGTERIMLVDDEEQVLKVEMAMLKELGYEVKAFSSSLEALEHFSDQPDVFDMVITDMTMPKMTGDKLAREIKAIRSDIPVILCTGFSELVDEKTAKDMGISAYITKPIIGQTFAGTVRNVLDEIEVK